MCGIAGKLVYSDPIEARAQVVNALDAMRRRGPDAKGIVSVELGYSTLIFGHARLSIIDLSEDGVQPMWSPDKRMLIIFNGEVNRASC